MNDWFEWNGVRSTAYGVHVIEPPSIIRAPERVMFTNVPGRSAVNWTGNVSKVVIQPNWRNL